MRQRKIALSNQETKLQSGNGSKWRYKDFLTSTQVAELLGIGRMSIYRYIRAGKIKVKRFDRKTLISKADLMAMFFFLPPKEETSVVPEKKDKTIQQDKFEMDYNEAILIMKPS